MTGYYDEPNEMLPMQAMVPSRGCRVPARIARLAYEEYAHRYGRGQSFERLHERGGFGTEELISLLADLVERERKGRQK